MKNIDAYFAEVLNNKIEDTAKNRELLSKIENGTATQKDCLTFLGKTKKDMKKCKKRK